MTCKNKTASIYRWPPTRVKQLRTRLKLSQTQFGGLIGATKQTVSNWECSRKSVTRTYHLERLSDLCHGLEDGLPAAKV